MHVNINGGVLKYCILFSFDLYNYIFFIVEFEMYLYHLTKYLLLITIHIK
jgi:hypothetical protein